MDIGNQAAGDPWRRIAHRRLTHCERLIRFERWHCKSTRGSGNAIVGLKHKVTSCSIHALRSIDRRGGETDDWVRVIIIVCISATLNATQTRSHLASACVERTECLFYCAD